MNSESACASETKTFRVETVPFESIPNQSKIFLDFQADSEKVQKYYHQKFSKDFVNEVLKNYHTDRNRLCNVLEETNKSFDAGEKTLANIEILREKDSVVVVTGQQAGLFTGALYTIYKILSAIHLAEDLRKQNIKAVPVFWIAEEDHDFDEVKKTFVLDRDGKLQELENTPRSVEGNSPVGFIELDATIKETEAKLFEHLQNTQFTEELKEMLSETYRQNETYSTAFAKMLNRIFGKYGLIIFSPLGDQMKKLSAPIFAEAVRKADEITKSLLERSKQLATDGYHTQVLVEKDFFPFFLIDEKKRLALKKNEAGNYQVKGTKREFSLEELSEIAENEPHRLSSNALMRSVVQDYLLPTVTYFGGAAEIAYFAQNAEIYRILNRPTTPIRHRASMTIVEPKNRRTFEKYKLNLINLFDGQEKIFGQIVDEFLASETAQNFAHVEKVIDEQLNLLDAQLSKNAPTLTANLDTRRRKILYHVNALMKKFQTAEMQKNEVVRRRLEFLFASLLPHKSLQERTLNITYFLNIYGENFIDWIYEAVCEEEKAHQILFL